jgi:hypothetical protein
MKIEVNANVNVHLHLPPVFTDAGVEEILEAIAILHKDNRMTTAALTRLVAASAALATQVTKNNSELEEIAGILREGDDSTDLNEIAGRLEDLLNTSKTAADDAQAAIDAHNSTGGTDTTSGGDTTTDTTGGGSGDDSVNSGAGNDTVTGGDPSAEQA